MNDNYIINDAESSIYVVCLYDTEKEKIILFQVSLYKITKILFYHYRKIPHLTLTGQKMKSKSNLNLSYISKN